MKTIISDSSKELNSKTDFQEIPLSQIRTSPTNPRKYFNATITQELAESIKITKGVLQPIQLRYVKPQDGILYEIVFGERRWRASVLAEMKTITSRVWTLTDDEAIQMQVIENLQREDITPLEAAQSYKILLEIKTKRMTVKEIALKISKTETYVYTRMQLLNLIEEAKELLETDIMRLTHALEICKLTPELQTMVLKQIVQRVQYGDDKGKAISCSTLEVTKKFIKSLLSLNLKTAVFDTKDKNLCSLAGACTGCTKRTGFNKTLFHDLVKDDRCMDEKCFGNKQVAHVKQLVKSMTKGKNIPLIVSDEYLDHKDEDLEIDVMGRKNWISLEEAKSEFDGAIPKKIIFKAISIEEDSIGEVIEIIKREDFEALTSTEDEEDEEINNNQPNQYNLKREMKAQFIEAVLSKFSKGDFPEVLTRNTLIDRISGCIEDCNSSITDLLCDKYEISPDDELEETLHEAFIRTLNDMPTAELCQLSKEFAILSYIDDRPFDERALPLSKQMGIELSYPEGYIHPAAEVEIPDAPAEAEENSVEFQQEDQGLKKGINDLLAS